MEYFIKENKRKGLYDLLSVNEEDKTYILDIGYLKEEDILEEYSLVNKITFECILEGFKDLGYKEID